MRHFYSMLKPQGLINAVGSISSIKNSILPKVTALIS
jgi:hypothetical protein